ncbi:hypothetical protein GCM10010517_48280 [Streptosporangium fragile]|uniref:Cytochrome b561 n=1 Tax=Streptosporangium fragile TaxID=46186 RepID=A0ABN3W1D7_9ACTN
MRRVFVALAGLLLLMIVAQFYLAAAGGFDTAPKEESFSAHRMLGMAVPLVSILVTAAAALSRAPGRLVALSALPAGLGVLQILIKVIADGLGGVDGATSTAGFVVFGLHAINALAIMGVSGEVFRRARTLSGAPRAADVSSAPAS